jgi:hypothetical protein
MRGFLVVGLLAACAHNVPQDSATGADGRIKGARPIRLENGEGIARGIVTYPGGDRVDWKSIELPTGKQGTLDLRMTYTTPRPGLRVAFDVFDQYEAPALPAVLHHHKRSREATIDHAKGTYFVRVFAPTRGDAGAYKLVATFHEDPAPIELGSLQIPDPPKLAAVPPPTVPCDKFDSSNTACADQCPDDAPATWKGCAHTCRTPDVNNAVCRQTMTCPTPPDMRVADCMIAPQIHWQPCADFGNPDPTNPLCAPSYIKPIEAHILGVEQQGVNAVITIDVGTNGKIDASWHVHVLRGNTDDILVGGEAKLLRVDKTHAIAKLKLTVDQVSGNQRVRLTPR